MQQYQEGRQMKTITIDTKKVKCTFEVVASTKTDEYWDNGDKSKQYQELSGSTILDSNRDRTPVIINGIAYRCWFTARLVTYDWKMVPNPDSEHSWDKEKKVACEPYQTASIYIQNLSRVQSWDRDKQKHIEPAKSAYSTLARALEPLALELLLDKSFLANQLLDEEKSKLERLQGDLESAKKKVRDLEVSIKEQESKILSLA